MSTAPKNVATPVSFVQPDAGQMPSAVVLLGLEGMKEKVIGYVWIDDKGGVASDSPSMLADWEKTGVVGLASRGQLFPKDGQKFLQGLVEMYKSAYLRAKAILANEVGKYP